MARSSYIYVVSSTIHQQPLAGFTVKHELVSWLQRRARDEPIRAPVSIYRLRDGASEYDSAYLILEKELLDG